MKQIDLPIGMMDQPQHVIDRFLKMVANGESPRLAEMLAVRKGPALDTDTAHFVGIPPMEKTLGYNQAKKVREQARKAGISISDSSFYNGTIADERGGGDPNAWLLAGDGKDKFKRVIRERGGACESLGVEFGESQERVDKAQSRIEKHREKRKKFQIMKQQLAADNKAKGELVGVPKA